jgi:cyclophilin family peptidyl-prolyl cis-trans isomerase
MSLLSKHAKWTHWGVTYLTVFFLFPALDSGRLLLHAACQENNPPSPETDDLQSLFQKWVELDKELADKEVQFKTAVDPKVQEELRGQYAALVEQSVEMVNQIKKLAVASIDAGTPDLNTSKILVGIIMNDAEFERSNEATKLGDRLIAAGIDGALFDTAAKAKRLSVFAKELLEELALRYRQHKQNDLPQLKIETTKGTMVVELFEDEAPNTVANFVSLAEKKFYDGLKFHRVVEGFVAQGGDPKGDGSGGPGYTIKCECEMPNARNHFFGSLSMAHAGIDTGGSQFFVCFDRTSNLDGKHTVFGRVIEGIEVLDKLARNNTGTAPIPNSDTDSIVRMTVVRKRDHEYVPETTAEPEPPPAQPETLQRRESESQDKSPDPDDN